MRCRAAVLLLLLAILTPSAPAAAQALTVGVAGGLNLARLAGDFEDEFDRRKGFTAGGLLIVQLGRVFAIQPELFYSQKGNAVAHDSGSVTTKLNYLEIPVLLRMSSTADAPLRPYLVGGPAFALRLSCDYEAQVEGETVSLECEDPDATDEADLEVRGHDIAFAIGAGIDFFAGAGAFNLEVRFVRGLRRLAAGADAANVKNESVSVRVGYRFGL